MPRTLSKFLAGALFAASLLILPLAAQAQSMSAACPVSATVDKAVTGTTYTVGVADQCALLNFTNASNVAVTLPNAATTFPAGFRIAVRNGGGGTVTITPTTSTINGAATATLAPGQSADIWTDHTNYVTASGTGSLTSCTASGTSPQTCNGSAGVVTTGNLTTATSTAASAYTISNSSVTAASVIACTTDAYSATWHTNGVPVVTGCLAGAGTIAVEIQNVDTTNALSGTVGVGFVVR